MAQALEAVFVHGNDQKRVDHTPSGAAVANGQIVDIGAECGICTTPGGIADGGLGSLATRGIFSIKKDATGSVNFARGALVYWDDTNNTAVAAAGAGIVLLGTCAYIAANGDEGVQTDVNVYGIQKLATDVAAALAS